MTAEELARLAKKVRDAQRYYFSTRTSQALNESKDHERRLDKAIDAILNPPRPGLFDEGSQG